MTNKKKSKLSNILTWVAIGAVIATPIYAAMATGISSDNTDYHINREVEGEWLHFFERSFGRLNYLDVTKADGTKIRYCDTLLNDLELESLGVRNPDSGYKEYNTGTDLGSKLVKHAQADFDTYLKKIYDLKEKEAFDSIQK